MINKENIEKAIDRISKPLIFKDAEVLKIEKGEVLLKIPLTEDLLNYKNELHGGMTFTLADYCAGLSCLSLNKKVSTLQASINYIKPGFIGPLYARSKVIHNGRSTVVIRVDVSDGNNEKIATGNYTMYVLQNFI